MTGPLLFAFAANSTDFLPIAAGVITLSRLKSDMKILLFLFILIAVVDVSTFILALRGNEYEWIHYIYTPIEYCLFIWALSLWQDKPFARRLLRLSIPAFAVICGLNVLALGKLVKTNSFEVTLSLIVYVAIAAYTLYNLQKNDYGSIWSDYRSWVCATLLFYSAASLVQFATMLFAFSLQLWQFHLVLNMISNIFFAGGFICLYRH
jgi:hypothetical protein